MVPQNLFLSARVREGGGGLVEVSDIKTDQNIGVKCTQKKKTTKCVDCLCSHSGFQWNTIRGCVESLSGPPLGTQTEGKRVGGPVAQADSRGSARKGQGTASEGYKSWWKCFPREVIVSTVDSQPPSLQRLHTHTPPQLFHTLKALSLRAAEGHEADERGNRGCEFGLMWLFDRTERRNKRLGSTGEVKREREGLGQKEGCLSKCYLKKKIDRLKESSMCNTTVANSGGSMQI